MSHCTKFDFKYSSEEAIVKAFRKMGIPCSTDLICQFESDFSKKVLGKLGYMGQKQYRAICGVSGKYQFFLCKIEDNNYELLIERSSVSGNDGREIEQLADTFRQSYIEVAVDEVVKKLDKGNMPSKVEKQKDRYLISFGSMLEYSILVSFNQGKITEEVSGIKGDFCTKLTEDLENILSHPSAELSTEWKAEYTLQVEDRNIQVLSLNF